MHILYLDDSGSPPNKNEKYFVLGGLSVPEENIRWLSNELHKLAIQIDNDSPQQVEFHASEMFSNRGIWKQFKREERIENIKRVLRTLDRARPGVTLFACAVHKASFPRKDPFELAFENLADRFNKYLQRLGDNERGIIVVDKSSYEGVIQNLASVFRQEGNRWGNFLTSICEVPLFIDSKASRNIQIADAIAYAVFRYYDQDDLTYFRCIESRFDRSETSIFGLVHKQNYNQSCTCPACVTRKR